MNNNQVELCGVISGIRNVYEEESGRHFAHAFLTTHTFMHEDDAEIMEFTKLHELVFLSAPVIEAKRSIRKGTRIRIIGYQRGYKGDWWSHTLGGPREREIIEVYSFFVLDCQERAWGSDFCYEDHTQQASNHDSQESRKITDDDNHIELCGFIGGINVLDEEVWSECPSGETYVSAFLETHDFYNNKGKDDLEIAEKTRWHELIFFDSLAKNAKEKISRSTLLFVTGRRLAYKEVDGRTGVCEDTSEIIEVFDFTVVDREFRHRYLTDYTTLVQ